MRKSKRAKQIDYWNAKRLFI